MVKKLTNAEILALRACPCLKVREAEQVFRINRNRLYRLMADGSLPFVQLGTVRLIRTEALESLTTPPKTKVAAE
jgi:excisionase family DNA binding protein